jgi:hypothetical protein
MTATASVNTNGTASVVAAAAVEEKTNVTINQMPHQAATDADAEKQTSQNRYFLPFPS